MVKGRWHIVLWSLLPFQKKLSLITIILINYSSTCSNHGGAAAAASFVPSNAPICNMLVNENPNGRVQVQQQVKGINALRSFLHLNNGNNDKNKSFCPFTLSPLTNNNKSYRSCHGNCSSLRSSLLSSEEIKTKEEETKGDNFKQKLDDTMTTKSIKSTSSIHLISLPPLVSSDEFSKSSPKIIKDIWKWKDVVLGDGRDYFIPRPRALKALSDILIGSTLVVQEPIVEVSEKGGEGEERAKVGHDQRKRERGEIHHVIEECAILSNCARMDILLSIETRATAGSSTCTASVAEDEQGRLDEMHNNELPSAQMASQILVAECLLDQLSSYENARKERGSSAALWEGISSFLDLPGMVIRNDSTSSIDNDYVDDSNDSTKTSSAKTRSGENSKSKSGLTKSTSIVYMDDVQQASKDLGTMMLRTTSQLDDIIRHFCVVAAGLARRDSRPDREVHFRPFSSRDAHIMLQLKRTAEVAAQYPRMKVILDSCLSAGKSSRDVKKVPILKELKKYDCEGKYSTAAPRDLALEAVEDVKEMVIRPAVEKCVMKLKAQDNSERIILFKSRVDDMMKRGDNYEKADSEMVKKLTHETIMKLRDGCNVDVEEILLKMNEKDTM